MKINPYLIVLCTVLFLGCGSNSDSDMENESENETTDVVCADATEYRVVFNAVWSADTHPDDFPVGAHFSSLIGATHSSDVEIWQTGAIASDGIETDGRNRRHWTVKK